MLFCEERKPALLGEQGPQTQNERSSFSARDDSMRRLLQGRRLADLQSASMKAHWFYAPGLEAGHCELSAEESHHAVSVLRLRAGEPCVLFDGTGRWGLGRLLSAAADVGNRRTLRRNSPNTVVHVDEVHEEQAQRPALHLMLAAPKGDRLGWTVEKCSELGAATIEVARFERSVAQPGASAQSSLARTALEACKQAHRARLPTVRIGSDISACAASWRSAQAGSILALGEPGAGAEAWGDIVKCAVAARDEVIAFVIGPEGGLTDNELSQLSLLGARPARLAAHVLRVETAAVAAAAVWADVAFRSDVAK